jgi:hypothetical protein
MSPTFRETALERSLSIDVIDELLQLHAADALKLMTMQGAIVTDTSDPRVLLGALLRQARFGLILRDLASAHPGQPLLTAVSAADERNRRER